MKNLFDYATKELSQDAFLRWLFENYNCEDDTSLKDASQYVLRRICKLTDDDEIINVKTYSQWHKIDIFTLIETNERKIALFIEDKVFSAEHNQLLGYNKVIRSSVDNNGYELNKAGCSSENVIKVFYKTLYLSEKEKTAVENAGWEIYDLYKIAGLFERFKDADCVLLKHYIEHVGEIQKALSAHDMPKSNEKGLDLIKWKAYFEFELLPRLITDHTKYDCGAEIGAYGYTYLYIMKKIADKENAPYIELRSRDISDDGLSATLLCYGVDYDKNEPKIKQVIDRIKTAPNHLFLQKQIRKDRPKQLGRTLITNEDAVSFLKKCIEDYDYIMQDW